MTVECHAILELPFHSIGNNSTTEEDMKKALSHKLETTKLKS